MSAAIPLPARSFVGRRAPSRVLRHSLDSGCEAARPERSVRAAAAASGAGMPESSQPDLLQAVHERSRRRWPAVEWPLDSYATHVGDERPPHLEDLYLGGAGGHRVEGAWAAIAAELSESLAARLRRQPCGASTPEDLVSDSIATLMADDPSSELRMDGRPPAKLIRYRGRTSLVNYFLVVAKRLAIGSHRKTRREQEVPEAFEAADGRSTGAFDGEDREQAARLFEGVRSAYDSLSSRQRFLLAMIYGRGMGKSDAGRLAGLPPWGVTRELDRVHDSMQASLKSLLPDDWAPLSREAWAAAWQSCWSDGAESPQSPAEEAPR